MSLNSKKVINCIRESEVYDYSTLMEDNIRGRRIGSELQMALPSSTRSYRDRNYIIKDIISKLVKHGELNKSNLMSYCGLNLKKHEYIIDYLESSGLIVKNEILQRKRTITIYKPTEKGSEFCRSILQSYEEMFPRKKANSTVKKKIKWGKQINSWYSQTNPKKTVVIIWATYESRMCITVEYRSWYYPIVSLIREKLQVLLMLTNLPPH